MTDNHRSNYSRFILAFVLLLCANACGCSTHIAQSSTDATTPNPWTFEPEVPDNIPVTHSPVADDELSDGPEVEYSPVHGVTPKPIVWEEDCDFDYEDCDEPLPQPCEEGTQCAPWAWEWTG